MASVKERNSGIDLLRIIAMILVVTHHFLGHGEVLDCVTPLSINWYVLWFLKTLCYVSVTSFYLISAFYQSNHSIGLKGIVRICFMVWFYSILCYFGSCIAGISTVSISGILQAVFPVMFRQYGFFNGYLLMAILAPFLNKAILHCSKKELLKFIVVLSIMCCVIPYISFVDAFNLSAGEGTLWIVLLYLIGSYLYKCKDRMERLGFTRPALVCLMLVFVQFLSKALIANVTSSVLGEVKYSGAFIGETPLLMVMATVALFIAFYNLRIKGYFIKKVIGKIAPLVFSVYLVSENNNLRSWLWSSLAPGRFANEPIYIILGFWLHCLLLIFSIPMCVEIVRSIIVDKLNLVQILCSVCRKPIILIDRVIERIDGDDS